MTLAGQTVFVVWLWEDYCYSGSVYSSREAIPAMYHDEDYAEIREVVIK